MLCKHKQQKTKYRFRLKQVKTLLQKLINKTTNLVLDADLILNAQILVGTKKVLR